MPNDISRPPSYASKSREQLIREIEDLRRALANTKAERQGAADTADRACMLKTSEREELFRMFFENMSEGFAVGEPLLDADGNPCDFRFIQANKAFEEQSGLSREMLGKPVSQILPNLEKEWVETYAQVAFSGEPLRFENYNQDLKRHFNVYCYSPAKGRFAILFTDVTRYKETEKELKQAHGLISGITYGTKDMIAAENHDFRYLFFNDAYQREFKKLWGKDIDVGTSMLEVLAPWPEEQHKAKELWRRALGGESFQVMMEFGPPDGEKRFYDLRFNPVHDSSGHQIGAAHILRNVTEEVTMRESLRESEEKYRSVFKQAAVGIGRVSFEDARWIEVNDTFRRMVGYSHEELRRIPWPQITHPDDLDLDLIPFRKMAAGKLESYSVEKRFIHKKGHLVWARLTLSLVRNAQGDPDYEIAIIEDITERKQMEVALQRSEERWNLALENFQEGAIIATEDEQIIYWNPAARRLHGFTRAEEGIDSLAKTRAVFDLLTTDGSRLLDLEEWPMRRIKRGETLQGLELRIRRPDQGWERVFSYSGTMVETAGGERLIFLSVHNLTDIRKSEEALRQSEKRFRALVTASSDVLYSANADWSEMRQLRSQKFLTNTNTDTDTTQWPQEYIPADEQPRVKAAIEEAVRDQSMFELEHRVLQGDGSIGWVFSRAVPLLNDRGEIYEWFGAAGDITKRKLAVEELEAANRELEAFSYSVSHDLRAPLRAIVGFGALLRTHADKLDGQTKEYLQRMIAGAEKMNTLIDDMLRLSRISRHEIVMEEIDLSCMARAVIQELEVQNPQKEVEIRIAPDLHTRGDVQLMKIALTNLLGNAWKYTGKTAQAYIEFGRCQKNGKMVFFVRDNGAGFPMDQVDRLFVPFQRLHTESEFSGTGIGLPIVHRVVNRHGGEIWAEAEVGRGAAFFFTTAA